MGCRHHTENEKQTAQKRTKAEPVLRSDPSPFILDKDAKCPEQISKKKNPKVPSKYQ